MKRLILASTICAAFTGCADKTETECDSTLQVECYARTTSGSNIPVKEFGMYVMSGDQPYEHVSNPVHVTYNGSTWTYPEIWINDNASIYAFYPYLSTGDMTGMNLSLHQQTDYLYTPVPIAADKYNNRVNITMEHLLSKIKVRIGGSEAISFKINDIETTATYNLLTNTLTPASPGTAASEGSEALIFPASDKVLRMDIIHAGKNYSYTAPSKSYEGGKEYTYNLIISDSKELVIDGEVQVTPWESGGEYDGTVRE